jgi:ankyrin repeat protein
VADFDTRNVRGQTPLRWAASNGHQSFVELLYDKNADLDVRDRRNQTPIVVPASNRHKSIIGLLLDKRCQSRG